MLLWLLLALPIHDLAPVPGAPRVEARLCDDVEQYRGFFTLRTGPSKHYFYWHFAARVAPESAPTVLWLTGGPGCSSEVALFGENGPCKVNADGASTTRNPFSWNERANLLYVDQPTGTGFSYGTGYDHDETGVANDMFDFLQQFFEAHPELSSNPFFIFGESYAGHYVPSIAHRVWRGNKMGEGIPLPLAGVGVGNGLTDPEVQYGFYPQMAISTNGHEPAVGTLTYSAMKLALPACLAAIRACNRANVTLSDAICAAAQAGCNMAEIAPYQLSGMNVYDMRIPCDQSAGGLCYDFSNIKAFLSRPEVLEYLGVGEDRAAWTDCNMEVNARFQGDWMKDYQQQLPDLLAAGIRVLIYAGDQDFICNWLGNKAWTLELPWAGKAAFNGASDQPWYARDDTGRLQHAGDVRTAKGLTFLRVYAAGHMVPMDQPAASLDMLDQFLAAKLG
ncbi:hypothetical protein KFE25_007019 [Diacronema lutheri]|uniref:Carboxypeptidase n=2 Tax=Diacronema lutheri TaxID=2081491 RepID=A0A8J5XT15_DIALT|nr:hypothetical protein KFE25_007019 [Diacronema lutheri]